MRFFRDQIIYSPSDLTRFMQSPYASWMDRLVLEAGDDAPPKDAPDEMGQLLSQKGFEHEESIEQSFVEAGCSIARIDGIAKNEHIAKTIEAMKAGVDVVIQGKLSMKNFQGFADFLVRVRGKSELGDFHYQVWDSKLSKQVKPTYLIQLCAYADMLRSIQKRLPGEMAVLLGNGERKMFKTMEAFAYYQNLKTSFLDAQNRFDPELEPDPSETKEFLDWSDHAHSILKAKDHPSLVAGITKGQIKKLAAKSIHTASQLAEAKDPYVPGIQDQVLKRLQRQALYQQKSQGQKLPAYKILTPVLGKKEGLAMLPPPSPHDVFFDIEGFPLIEGGLEYLWGATYWDKNGKRAFKDFWAHDPKEEAEAFKNFIDWAYKRYTADSSMHIYHYANYEIAACRKLMQRTGLCEFEVDNLLRNEVFVDLYKVVKSGMVLGEPRYSIKNVELLYRGKRDTDVGSGGDSVVVYDQWRTLNKRGLEGRTWQNSTILNGIRDYNIDDCNSTQELVDWLRIRQKESGIDYLPGATSDDAEEQHGPIDHSLRDDLLAKSQWLEESEPRQARVFANLAWLLDFHRRETKPVYWRLFERLGMSDVELFDDFECLAMCQRTSKEGFKGKPRSRNLSYEYTFDANQEFKGAKVSTYFLLGVFDDDGKEKKVTLDKDHSDFENGVVVLKSKIEPPPLLTLVPYDVVNARPIPGAIARVAKDIKEGHVEKHQAIMDFLMRRAPRVNGHLGGALIRASGKKSSLDAIVDVVTNLSGTSLVIQGPPGAGKSYTAKHAIVELLSQGKKVGITSNSHKAINHLLLNVAEHCKVKGLAKSFVCTSETGPELKEANVNILKNGDIAKDPSRFDVIGTTAWGFAKEELEGALDALFVDEAGQVAVANLVGMSASAKNIVLLGDQMQLGQPSQGTHPMESGESCLDYYLEGQAAIGPEQGIFLATTYRMHSAVNEFISQHIYEGQLASHPDTDKRTVSVPKNYNGPLTKNAGIVFVPCEHEGNTQASDEEVLLIKDLSKELLKRQCIDGSDARQMTWADILFVAPYNHQVNKLKAALGDGARVGTVDKFQGQEAPVVILSMCSSDANESPRGIDFLFDKNRLNVAISRAQSLAIVVGNPRLAKTSVRSADQLAKVNMFAGLMQHQDVLI